MDILTIMKQKKSYTANHFSMPNHLQIKAKNLCHTYNQTKEEETELRNQILQDLLGTYNNVNILPPFHCDYGFNIHFEGFALLNYNITMLDTSPITIGNGCMIGPGCVLACVSHGIHPTQRHILTSSPITLQDNVWLGANVTVCKGVTIGEGSIIAAGSIVTKDIPSYVIAGGNPCRVLRQITEEDIIEEKDIYNI